MQELHSMITLLAYFLGIPTLPIALGKIYIAIKDNRNYPDTACFYLIAAICWAWILH